MLLALVAIARRARVSRRASRAVAFVVAVVAVVIIARVIAIAIARRRVSRRRIALYPSATTRRIVARDTRRRDEGAMIKLFSVKVRARREDDDARRATATPTRATNDRAATRATKDATKDATND